MSCDLPSPRFLNLLAVTDRSELHLLKQTLNPIKVYLVTPVMRMPLFHWWAYLVRLVVVLLHRIHSWVMVKVIFLSFLLVACIAPVSTLNNFQH